MFTLYAYAIVLSSFAYCVAPEVKSRFVICHNRHLYYTLFSLISIRFLNCAPCTTTHECFHNDYDTHTIFRTFIPFYLALQTPSNTHRPYKGNGSASPALARRLLIRRLKASRNVSRGIYPINTRGTKCTHGLEHAKGASTFLRRLLVFYSDPTRHPMALRKLAPNYRFL